jgi:hypothetical protein
MADEPVLDWVDHAHWSYFASGPCIECGDRTNLLDDQRRFCHKVCAEARLEVERSERRAAVPLPEHDA